MDNHIIARLINGNKKVDGIYRSAAQYGFDDLIIEPRIVISETEKGRTTAAITEEMLEELGKTADEVIDETLERMKSESKIMSMGEMLVVTTDNMLMGAIAIITMRRQIEEMFPDGYIVLPSSIHEVLVLPKGIGKVDEMAKMVREINETIVAPEEQLSDNVYEF